jgi:hypothetical protein
MIGRLCVLLAVALCGLAASGVALADSSCPPGQYATQSGCVCPSGQHATPDGGCATDDLGACPAGQYGTTGGGCVCPAGRHVTPSGDCASDTTPSVGTAAVAGVSKTKVKKNKKHRTGR